jgi:hypothetical protein
VTLTDGSKRTFDSVPEVGVAGELMCQVTFEVVEGLATEVVFEDVVFASGVWSQVEPLAEHGEEE